MQPLPWALDLLGVPEDWTWAQFLNSQFLATVVGAIVAVVVARYGRKITEAASDTAAAQGAESATTQAAQIEAQQEEIEIEDVAAGDRDYRQDAKDLIEQGKKYLDARAEADPDGRHRRTYESLSRYDYMPLAVALNVRNQISAKQLAGGAALFARWKLYERGKAANKPVPKEIYDQMEAGLVDLTSKKL